MKALLKGRKTGKVDEGALAATLLRAKSKFKRKSRREEWMVYCAKFIHHRAHMIEEWNHMDEEQKAILESDIFDMNENDDGEDASSAKPRPEPSRQCIKYGDKDYEPVEGMRELMLGVSQAQTHFNSAVRSVANEAELPVHDTWAYFEERENQRSKYLAEQAATVGKEQEKKAMDFTKKKIPPWHPNESSAQCVRVPHKQSRRAQAKATEDYASAHCTRPPSLVRDVVRASFICDTADGIVDVYHKIRTHAGWCIEGVKNRFAQPSASGYRDVLVTVSIDVPVGIVEHGGQRMAGFRRVLGEIQIHHIDILRLTREVNGLHLYTFFRAYFGSSTMSAVPVSMKLKILKKMDQVATEPSQLEDFLENFLESGGRASRDLLRIWSFEMLLNKVREYDLAERMLRHIIMLNRAKGESAEHGLSEALDALTRLCVARRQYEKALPLATEAVFLSEKHNGRKSLITCKLLETSAILNECIGDSAGAMELFLEVYETRRALLPETDSRIATAIRHLAELNLDTRQFAKSEFYRRELARIAKTQHGETSTAYADSLMDLGWSILYTTMGDTAKTNFKAFHALHRKKKTATIAKVQNVPKHTPKATKREGPASGDEEMDHLRSALHVPTADDRWKEAMSHFQQALTLRRDAFGDRHVSVAMSLDAVADVLDRQGDYASAMSTYDRSRAIWKSIQGHVTTGNEDDAMDASMASGGSGARPPNEQTEGVVGLTEVFVCDRIADIDACRGNLMREMGDLQAAQAAMQEVETQRRQLLGEDDPKTAHAKTENAALLLLRDKAGEFVESAGALLTSAHKPLHENLGADAPATKETLGVRQTMLTMRDEYRQQRVYKEKMAAREARATMKTSKKVRSDKEEEEEELEEPHITPAYELLSHMQIESSSVEAELCLTETAELRSMGQWSRAFEGYRIAIEMFRKAHGSRHPLMSNLLVHAAVAYEDASMGHAHWFGPRSAPQHLLERALKLRHAAKAMLCKAMTGGATLDVAVVLNTKRFDEDALIVLCQIESGRAGALRQAGHFEAALESFLLTIVLSFRLEAGRACEPYTGPGSCPRGCLETVLTTALDDEDDLEPEEDEIREQKRVAVLEAKFAERRRLMEVIKVALNALGGPTSPAAAIFAYMTAENTLVFEACHGAAQCLQFMGRLGDAKALFECLSVFMQRTDQSDHPMASMCDNALAGVLMEQSVEYKAQGDKDAQASCLERAAKVLDRALLAREQLYGTTNALTCNVMFNVAVCAYLQERWLAAGKMVEQCLDQRERKYDECSLEVASCLYLVAEVIYAQNAYRRRHSYHAETLDDLESARIAREDAEIAKAAEKLRKQQLGVDDDDDSESDAEGKTELIPHPLHEEEEWAAALKRRADGIVAYISKEMKPPHSQALDEIHDSDLIKDFAGGTNLWLA